METQFLEAPVLPGIRLILVRHGQTDANLRKVLQGQSDGLLNETGIAQVEKLADHLGQVHIDRVISSDMRRAKATAQSIADKQNLHVELDPRIREWHTGDWDAMPAVDFHAMIARNNWKRVDLSPPNGETLQQIRDRAKPFLADLVIIGKGKTVLVCSHGDFMRALIGELLDLRIDAASAFFFDNASYSVLEFKEEMWKLIASNRIAQ